MVGTPKNAPAWLDIMVELFGMARLAARRDQVQIRLPSDAGTGHLAAALAESCPDLVGDVVLEDRSGLQKSYAVNLNGKSFVSGPHLGLKDGDTLLVFSSQAGG
jgi:molybdopterin converting factor small subunit